MMGKCPWPSNILSEKIARFVQFNRQEYSMSEQISALRRRMIHDMTIRNMSPLTQKAYVRAVKNFSRHFGKSPDQLTFEHVREYRLHLGSRGLGVQAINQNMCALRFFYRTTLGKAAVSEQIPLGRRPDALPPVLASDEVERFLKAVSDLEFRTAFVTIYAAGLRVSEAVALTIKDIDSARMVIHVRSGKGRKDRYVMLSEQLLGILRAARRSCPVSRRFASANGARGPACFLSGISGWFSLSLGAWVPNKLARRRMVSAARCCSTGSGRLD
jgi:integrase/recombinase XerD